MASIRSVLLGKLVKTQIRQTAFSTKRELYTVCFCIFISCRFLGSHPASRGPAGKVQQHCHSVTDHLKVTTTSTSREHVAL
jgi:hypothetical protein